MLPMKGFTRLPIWSTGDEEIDILRHISYSSAGPETFPRECFRHLWNQENS